MSDAAWHPDPLGRFDYRWWDGQAWTEHVSTGGRRSVDRGRDSSAVASADEGADVGADERADERADGVTTAADGQDEPVTEDELAPGGASRPVGDVDVGGPDDRAAGQDPTGPRPVGPPTEDADAPAGTVLAVAPPSRRPTALPLPLPPRSARDGPDVAGELVDDDRYTVPADVGDGEQAVRQNPRLLRVSLGPDVMIKRGSMVAYQGDVTFEAESEGGGVGSLVRRAVSADNARMARARGRGQLYLADHADEVHVLRLDRAGVVVNGPNLLAFSGGMTFRTRSLGNAGIAAGGVFVTDVSGTGWVAVTAHGTPVRLDTGVPTFVDAGAAVAWSSTLRVELNVQRLGVRSARSGELVQLAFRGEGFVLVQASEGPAATVRS